MNRLQSCLCVFAVSVAIAMPSVGMAQTPSLSTLYAFSGSPPDGSTPLSGVIMDSAGNLYGTTSLGGAYDGGAVFEIAAGTHEETVVYSFSGADGYSPMGSLIMDAAGNLYGTTSKGGTTYGTVYEIAAGTHEESVLYSFPFNLDGPTSGSNPLSGLVMDAAGNFVRYDIKWRVYL